MSSNPVNKLISMMRVLLQWEMSVMNSPILNH